MFDWLGGVLGGLSEYAPALSALGTLAGYIPYISSMQQQAAYPQRVQAAYQPANFNQIMASIPQPLDMTQMGRYVASGIGQRGLQGPVSQAAMAYGLAPYQLQANQQQAQQALALLRGQTQVPPFAYPQPGNPLASYYQMQALQALGPALRGLAGPQQPTGIATGSIGPEVQRWFNQPWQTPPIVPWSYQSSTPLPEVPQEWLTSGIGAAESAGWEGLAGL